MLEQQCDVHAIRNQAGAYEQAKKEERASCTYLEATGSPAGTRVRSSGSEQRQQQQQQRWHRSTVRWNLIAGCNVLASAVSSIRPLYGSRLLHAVLLS